MTVSVRVQMDVPVEATRQDVLEYVVDAVRSYKGGLRTDDPMFGLKKESVIASQYMDENTRIEIPSGSRTLEGWVNIRRAREYGDSRTYGFWNDRITLYKRPELSNSKSPLIQARLTFDLPEDGILVNENKLATALKDGLGNYFTDDFCKRFIKRLKEL